MLINIRKNCFETNSSSMHSIVVTNEDAPYSEDELKDDMYIHDHKYEIWNEENLYFGRAPFQLLTTFSEKLCYAIASLCGGYTSEEDMARNFEMIENIVKKHIPELKIIELPQKYEPIFVTEDGTEVSYYGVWEENDGVLYHHTKGSKEPVTRSEFDNVSPDCGYVDHESADLLRSFLEKKDITLEEFLINKKYCVVIDGDEYCEWEKMKETALINKDNIVDEYSTASWWKYH